MGEGLRHQYNAMGESGRGKEGGGGGGQFLLGERGGQGMKHGMLLGGNSVLFRLAV